MSWILKLCSFCKHPRYDWLFKCDITVAHSPQKEQKQFLYTLSSNENHCKLVFINFNVEACSALTQKSTKNLIDVWCEKWKWWLKVWKMTASFYWWQKYWILKITKKKKNKQTNQLWRSTNCTSHKKKDTIKMRCLFVESF